MAVEVHWGLGGYAVALKDPKKAGREIEMVTEMLDGYSSVLKRFQTIYIGIIAYYATFTFIKISILLFYRSIFPRRNFVIVTSIVGACAIA